MHYSAHPKSVFKLLLGKTCQGQAKSKKLEKDQGRPSKDKQGHKKGIRKPVKLPCLAISPGLKGTGDDALDSVDKEEKPAIHNREALEQ